MRLTRHHRWRSSPSLSQSPSLSSSSSSTSSFLISTPQLLLSLLLLLPLLVSCDVITESSSSSLLSGSQDASVEEALRDSSAAAAASAIVVPPQARPAVGTKYAPVDGQDGKPHMGAFVEISSSGSGPEAARAAADGVDGAGSTSEGAGAGADTEEGVAPDASAAEPTSLKRLSEEIASKDGAADGLPVSIPESNDGVMDDKNRVGPKQGTTGTEGGVSGKSLSSLEAKVPYAPKQAPGSVVGGEDVKVVEVVGEGEGVGEASGQQGRGIGGLEVC